jgi:SAM-dependent methyltransferase
LQKKSTPYWVRFDVIMTTKTEKDISPEVFDQYARYYDLLYKDKDYTGEARFVSDQLKAHVGQGCDLLELGCGTGRHAIEFSKLRYNVTGVDMSPAMVQQANARAANFSSEISSRPIFQTGDVRSVRVNARFGAVISLFHVMSYQITNSDIRAAVNTAAAHLTPEGLFLFDFWHGPAVLVDPPTIRVKRLEDDECRITRLAEPAVDHALNRVTVNYEILVESKKTNITSRFCEQHHLRYFSLIELENVLEVAGFEMLEAGPWLGNSRPGKTNWFVWVVARKRAR